MKLIRLVFSLKGKFDCKKKLASKQDVAWDPAICRVLFSLENQTGSPHKRPMSVLKVFQQQALGTLLVLNWRYSEFDFEGEQCLVGEFWTPWTRQTEASFYTISLTVMFASLKAKRQAFSVSFLMDRTIIIHTLKNTCSNKCWNKELRYRHWESLISSFGSMVVTDPKFSIHFN